MNSYLNNALHIVSNESAAGTLLAALGISRDQVLISEDPLSYGPAPATGDLLHWRLIREKFLKSIYLDWPDFSMDHYAESGLLNNYSKLADLKPVVVWVSPGLGEQLLLAWLTILFDHFKLDLSQLLVVQFDVLRPGQPLRGIAGLTPQHIRNSAPEPRALSKQEIEEYQSAWKAYTSSEPIDLMRFLDRKPLNELLFTAMRHLVYRYPSAESGLCKFDEDLLRITAQEKSGVTRIISRTMDSNNTQDLPGEDYLFHRLLKLGHPHRSRPLLTITGDSKNMRTCRAIITVYGQEVLDGISSALVHDEIDDWIGGVRLHKTMTIPLRLKDDLYLPM